MIGDALPFRLSRRIKRKAFFVPVKVSPKRKIRKSLLKKRASGVNSLRKTNKKTVVGGKNNLKENLKQVSKFSKLSSINLKPVTRKSPHKSINKIYDKKRKTTNFLKTPHVNLTVNKGSLKNELFDNSKKATKTKNRKKNVNEVKQSVSKEKEKNKKLSDSGLKPLNKKKPCPNKSLKHLTSEPILTPNPKKCTQATKFSGRKQTVILSTKQCKQEISASKPLSVTSAPVKKETSVRVKNIYTSRHSRNKKSGRLLKNPNKSRIMKSDMSLNTVSFNSLLETQPAAKHLEKRKSSRLLKLSPLRTLNKELPLSTPLSLLTRNSDSTLNKSCKSLECLPSKTRRRKQSQSKISNKDGSAVSHKRQQGNQKTSENFKKSLSNKSENFLFYDVLTTPTFKPLQGRCLSKKFLSKSDSKCAKKVSKKDSFVVSHKKQKQQVNKKTTKNLKKPLSNKSENLLLDVFTTPTFKPVHKRSLSVKYLSKSTKRKLNASASENQVASEELQDSKKGKSADFPKKLTKGTIKYKRWLLNNLKEKNGNYEDDIFENKNFHLYKPAYHFGDESDGSSINIATPKFDCILTPVLPKKTPRFKDCISPTEFFQARKSAEEYQYRRNKKRKGEERTSSGRKTSMNKEETIQEIPEKKKLDFDETVHKLVAVQKSLEIEAEVGDEEEDIYFSDASN